MEISNLPNKEFKAMVMKLFIELRQRRDEHSEIFNKKSENIRKFQADITKLKNAITELNKCTKGVQRRLDEAEE